MAMLVLIMLFLLALVSGGLASRADLRFLRDLDEMLLQVERHCLSGSVSVRLQSRGGSDPHPRLARLLHLLDNAQRTGLSLAASVAALRSELRAGETSLIRHQRLWRTALFRAATAVVLAGSARWVLCDVLHGEESLAVSERVFLGLCPWPLLSGMFLFHQSLPRLWLLGRRELSEALYGWLSAHLTLEPQESLGSLALEIGALRRIELGIGVSQAIEIHRRLHAWALEKRAATEERLGRMEELLPLFELIGIGTSVVLALIGPVLAVIETVPLG